jgi:hypothetical protein
MGYTHYWDYRREITDSEWKKIVERFRRIEAALKSNKWGIAPTGYFLLTGRDGTGQPQVTDEYIAFNGDYNTGEDYETFALDKKGQGFAFCKTGWDSASKKRYDQAVTAMLVSVAEIAPNALCIKSDGNIGGDDWEPGKSLVEAIRSIEHTQGK